MIESLNNELSNYISSSKKGNDQIDDSVLGTQELKDLLSDCLDKNNIIINNLNNYDKSGRQYLYSNK